MIDARVSHGQVQITMDVMGAMGILIDLRYVRETGELEPESEKLIDELFEKGIK